MKHLKTWLLTITLAIALSAGIGLATWPSANVNTTNLDSDTDSTTAARVDLLDLTNKFNQARAHVSAWAQGLLDDTDAAAGRATLGLGTMATQNASGVAITGGTISGTPISGSTLSGTSLALSGAATSTKACAAGYSRVTPNYCAKDAPSFPGPSPGTCATIALPSADAKALVLSLAFAIQSANGVEQRYAYQQFYAGTGCTGTVLLITSAKVWEAVAVNAQPLLREEGRMVEVPVYGGAVSVLGSASLSSGSYYALLGYYD